jgi:hypothetical protein
MLSTSRLQFAPKQKGVRISQKEKRDRYYKRLASEINPDRKLKYFFNSARKSAANRGIEFSITEEYFKKVWKKQKGKCAISGIDLTLVHGTKDLANPTKISTDRIDNSKGYVEGNIHLIMWQLNAAKGTWDLSQLVEVCRKVAEHNK